MDKMNQVSVTEFMSKSKEEMYDMAVEMVEKYNRLVDICNDGTKRMADLIVRHKVYTSALKNDIASKDTKIERLEKEIEGRKKAFNELKEEMANRYIAIETHNDICKTYENKVDELKEEVKKLNKCIMEKNESINTGNEAIINLRKQIGVHVEENKRLSDKIMKLNDTITELSHEIDNYKSWNADLHKDIKSEINNKNDLVDAYEKKYDEFEKKIAELEKERDKCKTWNSHLREELAGKDDEIEHWRLSFYNARYNIEKLRKEKENKEDDHGREGFERYIKYLIEEEETKFKAELNRKFSEEVSKISTKRTEEELAKMKGIPCGEDSIE